MKSLITVCITLSLSLNAYAMTEQEKLLELANSLQDCEPLDQSFAHLFTGETMQRQITGLQQDLCVYIEQMPNDGTMTCRYSEADRAAVAEYYARLSGAESMGTSVKTDLKNTEATYRIDGETVKNPLSAVMKNGVCTVTGY